MPSSADIPPPARAARVLARLGRVVVPLAVAAALLALVPSAHASVHLGEIAFGPHGGLRALGNVDLAPDGSGAVTYLVEEDGVPNVFVSRLVDGAWQGPERVDAELPGPSSQPVVAAADGGRLVVAFVNGGNIHAMTRASADSGWRHDVIWGSGGAANPHVDLSVNRKGYLVFTAPGGGGHDVRIAYAVDAGSWTLLPAPLDARPDAPAGVGAGRPRVGAAASGVAVVAWGESGRVYARRVMGTRPSVVFADALAGAQVEGIEPVAGDLPEVGVQDDDSYTGVAFRAFYPVADPPRPRALFRRLRGSRFEWTAAVDGTTFGSGQAGGGARIATIGVGQGLVVGTNAATNLTHALALGARIAPVELLQVDSIAASAAAPYAVPAASTARKRLVAWQFTAPGGAREIRARLFDGTAFEAEQTISVPTLGVPDAARGLDAAADDHGDFVIAWVQGAAIAVATVDQPPGRIAPRPGRARFERTRRPILRWTESREAWGAQYVVTVDGAEAGRTRRTALRVRTPLADGVHRWQVTVVDRRGQTFTSRPATVRVDATPPRARVRIIGSRRVGMPLRLRLRASDPAPRGPDGRRVARAGLADAIVDWGDRTRRRRLRTVAEHTYARPGRYVVRVTVPDKAGNRTVVRQVVRIADAGGAR